MVNDVGSIEVKPIVDSLDDDAKALLVSSAEIAFRAGHAALEPEHLLLALTLSVQAEVVTAVTATGIDMDVLQLEVEHYLEGAKQGNGLPPRLSGRCVQLLKEFWFVRSTRGSGLVGDALLLLALAARPPVCLPDIATALPQLKYLARLTEIGKEVSSNRMADGRRFVNKYTVDLTARARTGEIDPVSNRDAEILQLVQILLRRRQNNPILVGEAGVGKTAIVEGLAIRISRDDVPAELRGVELRALDVALLRAGAGVKGEIESRIKGLITEIFTSPVPIILFIDEIHVLLGSRGGQERSDIADIIKPELARGTLRTIGATTWSEYKQYVESDAALTRRFQPVHAKEPTEAVAEEILLGLVPSLEAHHRVTISGEAVKAAVSLTARYIQNRHLPDKAISALDTACAMVVAGRYRRGHEVDKVSGNQVDVERVAAVITDWTGVPSGQMLTDRLSLVSTLPSMLADRIKGQGHGIRIICDRLKAYAAGFEDRQKPIGVFLLAGPSGVGKTETAMALSELFFGTNAMTTINMSEYQEAHTVSKLKGAPAGYVGFGRGGILTEAIRKQPYGLLLLDEFEKAHPDVLNLFLQVFDKAVLEDAEGNVVDFSNTLVVMTSNAGSQILDRITADQVELENLQDVQDLLEDALGGTLGSPLLGRCQVVPYFAMSEEALRRICEWKVERISRRSQEAHGQAVTISAKGIDWVVSQCMHRATGARFIDTYLSQHVVGMIAEYKIKSTDRTGAEISIDVDAEGRFYARTAKASRRRKANK